MSKLCKKSYNSTGITFTNMLNAKALNQAISVMYRSYSARLLRIIKMML